MKKAKNILLLIGLCLHIAGLVCSLLYVAADLLGAYYAEYILYLIGLMLLVAGVPAVLLYRNLRRKTGRILPFVSAGVQGLYGAVMVFQLFAPGIPKYLVYSSVGLLDTVLQLFLSYLTVGAVFILLGCVSTLTGSLLSLKKEP